MPRSPRVSAREVVRALERAGFVLSRQRGSHQIYRHAESGRRVVVPFHGNRIIPPGTLVNILNQAGIESDDFTRLLGG